MSIQLTSTAGVAYINNSVVALGNPSFKNLLINGGFSIWQRGSATFSSDGYFPDRWYIANNTNLIANARNTNGDIIQSNYGLSMSSGAGTTSFNLQQRIEDYKCLNSGTGTLSMIVNASGIQKIYAELRQMDTDGSTTLWTSGIVYIGSTINGSTRLEYTFTGIEAQDTEVTPASKHTRLLIYPQYDTSSLNVLFNEIQLEEGSNATEFERRAYGIELTLCQRYYQMYLNIRAGTPGNGISRYFGTSIALATEMREAPTTTPVYGYTDASTGSISILNKANLYLTALTAATTGSCVVTLTSLKLDAEL